MCYYYFGDRGSAQGGRLHRRMCSIVFVSIRHRKTNARFGQSNVSSTLLFFVNARYFVTFFFCTSMWFRRVTFYYHSHPVGVFFLYNEKILLCSAVLMRFLFPLFHSSIATVRCSLEGVNTACRRGMIVIVIGWAKKACVRFGYLAEDSNESIHHNIGHGECKS